MSEQKQVGAMELPASAGESIRDRILLAAFGAFTTHGYAQTSTLEIATRARVSKRELYSLFGNKQQMLVACIGERGERMRLPPEWPVPRSRKDLEQSLVKFGSVLLHEITDPDVIATFRLAIAEADRSPQVAQALQSRGRQAVRTALREILESAQSAGVLDQTDPERMVSRYMALLLEDVVLTLALGLAKRPSPAEIRRRATEATEAFLKLFAASDVKAHAMPRTEGRRKAA
jgi:AcrR family transcriptional regulator